MSDTAHLSSMVVQFAVDADAAVVVDDALLLDQFRLAQVEDVVQILRVVAPHHHVPQQAGKTLRQSACERIGRETAEGGPGEDENTLSSPGEFEFLPEHDYYCINAFVTMEF